LRDLAGRQITTSPFWEKRQFPDDLFGRRITLSRLEGLQFMLEPFVFSFYSRAVSGRPTQAALRFLDWLARHTLPPEKKAEHHRTGRRGEEAAYFHLRRLGYTMVTRNFRSPRCRGEIDLIGWEDDVLCFVEVKTRTTRDVKPGEAAVDRYKRKLLAEVIREYLRRLPPLCQWRFDVVSVYYGSSQASPPQIEVFRNSSLSA
jgi:putative endonuclease